MPDEKKAPSEADAATEKIVTVPDEKPVASAAKPVASEAKPVAKPIAAPRRIPPRGPSSASAKGVATEKKLPVSGQQPGPKQAGPQRIGPAPTATGKPSHKKWWAALVAAVVVVAAVAAGAYLLVDRTSVDESSEARIRTTVESFTRALAGGDLATLRSTSCGDLATFYRDIPDAEFADVHRVSVEQGSIPTVDSIDAIQVSDDSTAIAQVIAHTDANPNDRSPRTFDLRLEGDRWKVCS